MSVESYKATMDGLQSLHGKKPCNEQQENAQLQVGIGYLTNCIGNVKWENYRNSNTPDDQDDVSKQYQAKTLDKHL